MPYIASRSPLTGFAVLFTGLCAGLCSVAACHSSAGTMPDAAEAPDLALPGGPYPAALTPDVPQVITLGGPIAASPKVVAITFPDDPFLADIETFVSTLGATPYWKTVTGEYGVGPLVSLTPIHLTDAAPAAITDDEIQAWLADRLDGTHPEWPAPTTDTIYTIFYPASTVISLGTEQSCQFFGGYHSDAGLAGSDSRIVYAVLPRCSAPKMTTLQYLTSATSHELIEASEDPLPMTNPAYGQVDTAHSAWTRILGGGESADLCQAEVHTDFQPDGFAYMVQRNWSNAAAAAGQDPCIPAYTQEPYFNTTPDTPLDDIVLTFMGFETDSKGWVIPVGQEKTVELELYSDAPTTAEWKLEAIDVSAARTMTPSNLQLNLDKASGKNGEKVMLTIKALSAATSRSGTTTVMVRSSLGEAEHFWLGLVQSK